MKASKAHIKDIIPHREPFIMIDKLTEADEEHFVSTFKITGDNIFTENEFLAEPALIENIAQTCAAGFGYLDSQSGDSGPKIGFIGAISRLEVFDLPQVNSSINTTVTVKHRFENIFMVEGVNRDENGKQLVSCNMKIVVTDEQPG